MPERDRMSDQEKAFYRGRLLEIMIDHVGKSRIIGMGELYEQVFGAPWAHRINDTRRLRKIVEELRRGGAAICAAPARVGGGYYLSNSGSELAEFCGKLRRRALKILSMEARIRKISMPELVGQLRLDLETVDE
jgi:hypothetical protein